MINKKCSLRIVFITQEEPFYLSAAFKYFFSQLTNKVDVAAVVITPNGVEGRRRGFFSRAIQTIRVFGIHFFGYYAFRFLSSKFNRNTVGRTFEDNNVPVIYLDDNINNENNVKSIKSFEADLLISISSNQIFKRPVLDIPKMYCLNVHTSCLPKYRGLLPTFWAMLHDEKEIGVSIFKMDEGIDTGEIMMQTMLNIEGMTQEEIIVQTKMQAMRDLQHCFEVILSNDVLWIANNDDEATYFGWPTIDNVKSFTSLGKKFF